MNTVTVNKEDLIAILTTNRDKHLAEYTEAYEGYKLLAIKALEERLELIKSGEKFNVYFGDITAIPENHVDDYQNVIDMLSICSDTSVQITMEDYQKYYKNNWAWVHSWALSNKMYVDAYHMVS
jgi:hypothetical protein